MPKIGPLDPERLRRALVVKLGPRADSIRQVATNLGARPYRCFLVHTVASGEERGEGGTREVSRVEILPTPRVRNLDALSNNPFHAGVYPVGSIRVEEVSTRYTEDQLRGLTVPAAGEDQVPERYDFFWEVRLDGRDGGQTRPGRYRVLSWKYDAGNVYWAVVLERILADDARVAADDDH